MSIADKLTRLENARLATIGAIEEMGGTVNEGDGFESFPADIRTIPQGGGEEFVKSYTGDGGRVLDTSDLPSGLYHGHIQGTATANADAVGFYLLKQDLLAAYMIKSKAGNYRNYVSQNGQINSNSANFLFTGTYDVYKVSELEY